MYNKISNNKKSARHRKPYMKRKMRKKENIRKFGNRIGEVADPELTTVHHLRKRNTSPRANITLSGKKKRKFLKQLKHMQKDKERMDVDVVESLTSAGQVKTGNIEMTSSQQKQEAQVDAKMIDASDDV